jgi:hypothetical protein
MPIHRSFLILVFLLFSNYVFATSTFQSYITDLSPPYFCKLKLKSANGVSLDTKHSYQFSGICSIKIPVGNTWIYQDVWVDLHGDWNGQTNEALETTTLFNNQGSVVIQLKCDDDPWLTKAQCSLVGYQNNTQFSNLGGVYNERNGQYPPFQIMTGQYPPLGRNQAITKEAISLSLLSATQQAAAARAQFEQTFGSIRAQPKVEAQPTTRVRKIFKQPRVGKVRLNCCLKMNQECGKPAADEYCRSIGYQRSSSCKMDNNGCSPTFLIGTKSVCNQPFSKGFEEVECEK